MPKFEVSLTSQVELFVTVEADDEEDAVDKAFEMKPDGLCSYCSGYSRPWKLNIPDDNACWESSAEEVTG